MDNSRSYDDWCDDERKSCPNFTCKSTSNTRANDGPSLGSICKDILQDIDSSKHRTLWNEVEYKNLVYETYISPIVDDMVQEQENPPPVSETTHQKNEEVFDALVNSKFAST